MKRGVAQIEKSLEKLLEEIFLEKFDDFREYLIKEQSKELRLSHKVVEKDLSFLARALESTDIIFLDLTYNEINDDQVKILANRLINTNVSTINLRNNPISTRGTKEFNQKHLGGKIFTVHFDENLPANLKSEEVEKETTLSFVPGSSFELHKFASYYRMGFNLESLKKYGNFVQDKNRKNILTPYYAAF